VAGWLLSKRARFEGHYTSGWGTLLCEDEDGNHVTLLTTDIEYQRLLVEAPGAVLGSLEVPADKYPLRRAGWPDEWT
jgi:hypothetical protein